MSWESIVKQDEDTRETLRRLGINEITDALSMLTNMVEKKGKYKGDFLLKKVKKYLEDYLERTKELR